ncbi:MAG TPA: universal stress protein [Candidatus Limnocylindria bacterium]|nr:universal stress protein [Candidatus Limnocylindria bacterium]
MKRILVAYDGGEPAKRALTAAADLAQGIGAQVNVISVVPRRAGRFPVDPWDTAAEHDSELLEARDYLVGRGLKPELIESSGDPAHEIERVTSDGDYDIVVVGARHLSGIDRILSGSVSEHVAAHASATVVVAR